MMRHTKSSVGTACPSVWLWACLWVWQSGSATYATPPDFSARQVELFSVPGSLSNAWADFDADGDLDFAVSVKTGAILLYRNEEGLFASAGVAAGLPESGDEIRGLSWGDYDGDGDLDLFAGSNTFPVPSRSYLFQNQGDGTFREVAEEVGASTPGRFSRQANWVDVDGDGDLDLYATNRAGFNQLLLNDAGRFESAGFASGAFDSRRSVGACWFDHEGDGDLDLFLANQSGDSDALLRNDGGRFVDIAPELDIHQTLRTQAEGGVGCAVGDYDNDGDFDLFVATYGANHLYRKNEDGSYTDVAAALGVVGPDHTVGAAWGDYDNDGWLDLAAVGYRRVGGEQAPWVMLYRNTGDGFENVVGEDHLLQAGDHGVEWVDYDGDGDLDLSLTDGYGAVGGHVLFRNELGLGARCRFVSVEVRGDDGRPAPPGTEVRMLDERGRILGSRLVSTGGGYNTQSAVPLYFALSRRQPVRLEVRYKSGAAPRVRHLEVERIGPKGPKDVCVDEDSAAESPSDAEAPARDRRPH